MKAYLKAQDGSYFNLAPKVTTIGREGCDLTIQVSTKWQSVVDACLRDFSAMSSNVFRRVSQSHASVKSCIHCSIKLASFFCEEI